MRICFAALGLLAYLWSAPVLAREGEPEGPTPSQLEPPPKGKGMYRAGVAIAVYGAAQIVAGTAMLSLTSFPESVAFLGPIPLALGGGFVTLGGLLMHFGEKRRFAYRDWQHGRMPPTREQERRQGAGAILTGTLMLAGGATAFTAGMSFAPNIGKHCSPQEERAWCVDFSPTTSVPLLTIGGTSMVVGSVLMGVGIHRRSNYLERRVGGRMVLLPTAGASARGAFIGLSGRF